LLLFVMSLPFKMIGVEIICCCQMVYLSMCMYEEKPVVLAEMLGEFGLVTGYWAMFAKEEGSSLMTGFTDRVELSSLFI
jgi:hypothetical protein